MILKFPDLDTLRLSLTAGILPAAVVQAPVVAGFDDQGQLWVECKASLARNVLNELRRLNVVVGRALGTTATAEFASWLELVPLQPDSKPPEHPEQLPVLFELCNSDDLSHIVFEILRLGNDRQSFRWLGNDDGDARALLRVVGPPYYSLLRAIDRDGKASAPVAYVERAPHVWVELGQTHPLLELIKPPNGKLLFLCAPQRWTLLDDAPFRDIYDVMEFTLPNRAVAWQDKPVADKIKVALSMRSGGPLTGAQLWVLLDDPEAELNRFVQNANEHLLTCLAFAVGEKDGHKTIVVRSLHSKSAPPELVLNATPYRSHLRLPNLFLPLGMQLHPHLRRDVVRKLLADDTDCVVWLASGENGSFTPHTLPENSFRPLTDWVAYVLDRATEPLQAWMQALRFDFESFVCNDDETMPKKPREPKEKRPKERKDRQDIGTGPTPGGPAIDYVDRTKEVQQPAPQIDFASDFAHAEPDALQLALRAAEEHFLSLEGDLDAPERRKLWPRLAHLNGALAATDDAGLCWLSAMWFQDQVPAQWAQSWLQVEAAAVQVRAELKLPANRIWATGAASGRAPSLDALLTLPEPSVADLRALAAHIVWAGVQPTPPPGLLARLNEVQRFLVQYERLLPVRAVWLAWLSLVRLSGGDVLALARTRDRLLERLYQSGLRPESDLPSFLRFSGRPANQRFQGVRQWMTQLCELAHMWAEENGHFTANDEALPAPTKGYIDLLFAFGLARLGEQDACRHLLRRAAGNLTDRGPVHALLLKAFDYRIRQALEGKPHAGPLPDEYFLDLNKLDDGAGKPGRLDRYAAERMQCEMRILDPDHVIDPYRHSRKGGWLDKALAELADLRDPSELAARVETLWQQLPKGEKGVPARTLVLREALNLGPCVNEEFSRKMLERTVAFLDDLPPPPGDAEATDQAELLGKALFVTAHFDRTEHVQPLVTCFKKLLQIPVGPLALQAIVKTGNKCFRGFRKLGLREESDNLLTWMSEMILGDRPAAVLDPAEFAGAPERLQILLELAGGWCYLNRDRQAEPVLSAARALLFKGVLRSKSQTALARSYIDAVGQGSVETAQARLEDLFTHVRGVRDNLTTKDYYNRHQLEVIESVVLAVTHDDFTLGATARRWLEDDEFLVRKRIHHDVRAMVGKE